MPTLEIPNLPPEVYQQIEKLARVRGKSVADVAADFLAKALTNDDEAEARLMAEVRADRERMAQRGVRLTETELREARDADRK